MSATKPTTLRPLALRIIGSVSNLSTSGDNVRLTMRLLEISKNDFHSAMRTLRAHFRAMQGKFTSRLRCALFEDMVRAHARGQWEPEHIAASVFGSSLHVRLDAEHNNGVVSGDDSDSDATVPLPSELMTREMIECAEKTTGQTNWT